MAESVSCSKQKGKACLSHDFEHNSRVSNVFLLQYFKTKMSARRVSRPRIDQDMKSKMMLDHSNGKSEEEIAEKYDIHVEYVRRALKSAARASTEALSK